MRTSLRNLHILPALIAGLGLILSGRAAAQTYTFGPEVQTTPSANITYSSGTGVFQYTDAANLSDDYAGLPLTGNAATFVTTSHGWTASLTVNLSARTMTSTSSQDPFVGMGLFIVFNNSPINTVEIGLEQVNDTGLPDYSLYGTGAIFAAKINGENVQTTPLDGSQLFNNGTSLLPISAGTNASPATETINAASGVLTLIFNPYTDTLTGYYNGTPVGSISLTGWGSNPSLTLAVVGVSGYGVNVPAGTDTASNFLVVTPSQPPPPTNITLLSPAGSVAFASTQLYTWEADTNATQYELYVTLNGSLFVDKWYALGDLMVVDGTNLSADVSGHAAGSYQWWVRGYGPGGLGPWSKQPMSFTLGIPGAVVLFTPTNSAILSIRQPELTWSQSFPAATWFQLYVARNGILYLDQWIAGATNWTPTADLPAGSYSWWVQTYNSAGLGPWSTNSTFTIQTNVPGKVMLVSPIGSVPPATTQLYTWQADAAAIWYELYVAQNGTELCDKWFTLSDSLAQSGSGNFVVAVSGHTGGSYEWYVRGASPDGLGPWSNMGSFTMPPPPPPGSVTLLTPTNNAVLSNRQPVFTWTASSPAADWYDMYLLRNGIKYIPDQWVQGMTNWVPASGLPGGSYTWWVHPWNAVGYGLWSTTFTFTIQTAVPGAITLVSPSGSMAAGSTQRYTWKADPAATWYELYVIRSSSVFCNNWYTLSNSVVDITTGNFAVDVSGHSAGTYQWYVRGWGPDGLGPWSGSDSFTVQAP